MGVGALSRKKHLSALAACMLTGALAQSAELSVGDWAWNIDDPEMFYAATVNGAGNLLAQYCYTSTQQCLYAVGFNIDCEPNAKYPALVNTDSGAKSIQLLCREKSEQGKSVMVATDFDELDSLVRAGSRIGFVIPMESDDFRAIRFSLEGSVKAIDSMRSATEKVAKQAPPRRHGSKPAVERLLSHGLSIMRYLLATTPS